MKNIKGVENLIIFCTALGTVTATTLTIQRVLNKTGLPWAFVMVYWLVTSIFYFFLWGNHG